MKKIIYIIVLGSLIGILGGYFIFMRQVTKEFEDAAGSLSQVTQELQDQKAQAGAAGQDAPGSDATGQTGAADGTAAGLAGQTTAGLAGQEAAGAGNSGSSVNGETASDGSISGSSGSGENAAGSSGSGVTPEEAAQMAESFGGAGSVSVTEAQKESLGRLIARAREEGITLPGLSEGEQLSETALQVILLLAEKADGSALLPLKENKGLHSLHFVCDSNNSSLNYLNPASEADWQTGAAVVDTLTAWNSDGTLRGQLAESWQSSGGNTVWTFHIRQDLKWVDSSGHEVTGVKADDWVAAWEYVTGEPGTSLRSMYEEPVKVTEVRADNDYTLVYTLETPCAYFPAYTMLPAYLPVSRPFLAATGEAFGKDRYHLLYCGPYVLDETTDSHRLYVRNDTYFDRENIIIDSIEMTSSPESGETGTGEAAQLAFLKGKGDIASVEDNLLPWWRAAGVQADLIHPAVPDMAASGFYAFNFDPQFDAEYEPDNWRKAVQCEDFRLSIAKAIDRKALISPDDPGLASLAAQNTITPAGFAFAGQEYTKRGSIQAAAAVTAFDERTALQHKANAMVVFSQEEVSFPVKLPLAYDADDELARSRAFALKEMLEARLGADYIEVIPLEAPADLQAPADQQASDDLQASAEPGSTEVPASGETGEADVAIKTDEAKKYAMYYCTVRAGVPVLDSFSDPFAESGAAGTWSASQDETVKSYYAQWSSLAASARQQAWNSDARQEAFAQAESVVVAHAIAIPVQAGEGAPAAEVSILGPSSFAASPFGVRRYDCSRAKLYNRSMSVQEYRQAYEAWLAGSGAQ